MKKTSQKTSHLSWILKIWRERIWLIALLLVLTLLSSAVAVLYPYIAKLILDSLQSTLAKGTGGSQAMGEIARLTLILLAVGAGGFVSDLFPGIRAATNTIFDYLLRKRYFEAVLSKDYRFFSAFRSGDILTRLTEDVSDNGRLAWFLCSGIFRAVEAFSKIAFCLGAMFLLNPSLTLLSLIPVPLMIGVFWYAQNRIYDSYRRNQEAISDVNNQLEMSFAGARIIKAYACEEKYGRFFDAALARRYATEMGVAKLDSVMRLIYQYIEYFAQIGIIFAGGYMAVKGSIGIGTFYAFYNYLGMLIYPMLDIPQLLISGKRSFANIDRLEEIGDYPSERSEGSVLPARAQAGSVELKNLCFSYPGKEGRTLDSISFSVGRGEKIAVIGPVGCGKSTLMKILCGVLYRDSGELRLGAVGMPRAIPEEAAADMGYVPQEPLLFSGTVRENMAFGSPGAGLSIAEEKLWAVLGIAQIDAEVRLMPAGADSVLGQRGSNVSGGQKQRLAIARALAREPKILLLDDITASLDAGNEERLMAALSAWSRDLTCFIVSHRLSTLQHVDRIMFMDSGRIVGFGRHEELMSSTPAYAAFIAEHAGTAQPT